MAEAPTDPRWPPEDAVDFDSILGRLLALKRQFFPEHTARDDADPFIQLLRLVAALGQHTLSRANSAMKQLGLKTATSRSALISMLEILNRPLRPIIPARGYVYAKLSSAPTVSTVVISAGDRIVQPGSSDPVFTVDEDISTGASVSFNTWKLTSAGVLTAVTYGAVVSISSGDSWLVGFDELVYDGLQIVVAVGHPSPQVYSVEYRNEEEGQPNSVTDLTTEIRFSLMTYLHGDTVDVTTMVGIEIVVTHKTSGATETVPAEVHAGTTIVAITSPLGQTTIDTNASNYSVSAMWRPVQDATATTTMFTSTFGISFPISSVRSETDWWESQEGYGYLLRIRQISGSGLPDSITVTSISIGTSSAFYATAYATQGYRSEFILGQTDGTAFQQLPLSNPLIEDPINDPESTIIVGGDADWSVVEDFSNSGSSSKHVILREDVDLGWCAVFGDGTIGLLPSPGGSVKITHRSGSSKSGNLDADTSVKASSSAGLVRNWQLPRGFVGYEAPECSTAADVLRFRANVVPQLALRAESVVTPDEITTAMSGGAANRATFETSDGRRPFSRALWTVEGAGTRQYQVVVVGITSDADGSVDAADLTDAAAWLNGTAIGVQLVGGHGPQNTEALVNQFTQRMLLPTIAVTVPSSTGVRGQIEQVVRLLLRPHALDEDGGWRWEFGGSVPVAVLFGKIWDAVPGRTALSITLDDSSGTYTLSDSVSLGSTELPVLNSTFDPDVDITITVS